MKTKPVGKKAKDKKEDFAPTKKEAEKHKSILAENPLIEFEMIEIKCNVKRSSWIMKIELKEQLKLIERFYQIAFKFNSVPFENQIKLHQSALDAAASQSSLFKNEDRLRIERIERDIAAAKDVLRTSQRTAHTIEFTTEVKKVEYGNPVKVIFTIPNEVVSTLNDKLALIEIYGIKLTKLNV